MKKELMLAFLDSIVTSANDAKRRVEQLGEVKTTLKKLERDDILPGTLRSADELVHDVSEWLHEIE